ncbi:MAG: peptide deformylase [bacterium]
MNLTKNQKIEILQKENPILRKMSFAIPINKIKTLNIKKNILLLKTIINNQYDAAAISAVQINKPIRLFLISKKVFSCERSEAIQKKIKIKNDLIFINPKIIKISKNKQLLEEGCLSVKYVYGKVLRPEKVSIEAYDETGKKFSRGFSGLLAQIVQHEIDHLNGILFIDKAIDIQKISPEEYEKMFKN